MPDAPYRPGDGVDAADGRESRCGGDSGAFTLTGIPLPPPDNRLVSTGRYGTYATPVYQEWFLKTRSILVEALGEREIDTAGWWRVEIRLRLGKSDGPNHTKAILDWLTGRYALEKTAEIGGIKRSKGALIVGRGLWDDDRRVRSCVVEVLAVHCAEPSFDVTCRTAESPINEAASLKAAAVIAKESEREAARSQREAAKAEAKAAAQAAKEQAKKDAGAEVRTAVRQALALFNPATQFALSRVTKLPESAVRKVLTDMQIEGEARRTGKGWELA